MALNERVVDHQERNETVQYFNMLQRETGQVFEVRAIAAMMVGDRVPYKSPRIVSGYFTDGVAMTRALQKISSADGIYITVNPCKKALLNKAVNRLRDEKGIAATADTDIDKRQTLFLDCDPDREGGIAGIPATEAEHQAALDHAKHLKEILSGLGWPDPIEIDSGNGAYLEYAIDLPVDDAQLVQRVLIGLSRYDAPGVHVDQTGFNPSRIGRIPGTLNAKADETEDRPYRYASIISVPDSLETVSKELLEAVAVSVEQTSAPTNNKNSKGAPININDPYAKEKVFVEKMLEKYGLEARQAVAYNKGFKRQLPECPFCAETDHNAFVYYSGTTGYGFKCSHNRCKDVHWAEFNQHFDPEWVSYEDRRMPSIVAGPDGRDEIVMTLNLEDDARSALGSVINWQEKTEKSIFSLADSLVRIDTNTDGAPVFHEIGVSEMKGAVNNAANVHRLKKIKIDGEDSYTKVRIYPPDDLVRQILTDGKTVHHFPPITGIISTPIVRIDGTILDTPGYDEKTKLYYKPSPDLEGIVIPDAPTKTDAKHAVQKLQRLIKEFPFEGQADSANTLDFFLKPFVKYCVKGDLMASMLDATDISAGKGLIVTVQSLMAQGEYPSVTSMPTTEEEMNKTLLAFLQVGTQAITFDNIRGEVASGVLEGFLTCKGKYVGRALGSNTLISVPTRATLTLTGNHMKLSKDMARRCIRIRLVPVVAHQDQRTFEIKDLEKEVLETRKELVAAILTMIRAWFVAGKPKALKVRPINSSFQQYVAVMAGILEYAGVSGYLDNIDKLYEEVDTEGAQWAEFISEWYAVCGTKEMRTKDIVSYILDNEESGLSNTLPGALRDEIAAHSYLSKEQAIKKVTPKFGKAIESKLMTAYGTRALRINSGGKDRLRFALWYVNTTEDRANLLIVADSLPAVQWSENKEKDAVEMHRGQGSETISNYQQGQVSDTLRAGSTSHVEAHSAVVNSADSEPNYQHTISSEIEEISKNDAENSADSAQKVADSGQKVEVENSQKELDLTAILNGNLSELFTDDVDFIDA